MAKWTILRKIGDRKDLIIPTMGRGSLSSARLGALLGALLLLLLIPGRYAQGADAPAGKQEPATEVMGESCDYVKQQRKGACKKSAETCGQVQRLDALNLIKSCALLAQECDLLGDKEDVSCQPGGSGRVTLHH